MEDVEESWIDKYIILVVDRYFGKCGLAEDALKELMGLPRRFGEENRWG